MGPPLLPITPGKILVLVVSQLTHFCISMLIMVSSQLCALGTVGVAAAGLAFGRPQHSIAARPTSNKRRAIPSTDPGDLDNQPMMPVTPSPLQPSSSASTSRLRKRASAGRPISSGSNLRGGIKTEYTTPNGNGILDDGGKITQPSLHLQQSRQSIGGSSFAFEHTVSENVQPSWLHRKSTLSSLKSGSPTTTERPGSSSIAYSNGSAAPIFPRDNSPSTPSRNKLVKRSSSQRALDGGSGLHSALRRPATSHQRSATLQRQYILDNEAGPQSSVVPSILNQRGSDPGETYDHTTQVWRPFFRPHVARPGRDMSSRKRNARGGISREYSLKCVIPNISELPTLVMATSISTKASHEDNRRISSVSAFSRPFTPLGWRNYDTPTPDDNDMVATEPKPRTSFSITDMFPSPSPATWKVPRTGSLRNRKSIDRTGGRRAVSAPQSLKPRPILTKKQDAKGFNRKSTNINDFDIDSSPLAHKSGPMRGYQVPPSSPLPPLNRLSAFEVDLPETVPSYPTSPLAEALPPSPRNFSPISSPLMSSQMVLARSRNQSHRPSGALSDHTSTLLGSENDNSRVMSGDEEDTDIRSETVFDSTRTAATGNSLAGLKRPPIETIFDESLPTHLPRTSESIGRNELLAYVSFDQKSHVIPTTHEDTKSIQIDHSNREKDEILIRSEEFGRANPLIQNLSPSISAPLKLSSIHRPSDEMGVDDNEALWSFDHSDDRRRESIDLKNIDMPNDSNLAANSPRTRENTPRRRRSPPAAGVDRSSKANIFEWSEHLDNEASPGGSPRPKTVHGRQGRENGGSRSGGRRGPSALHLRSQSVPVPNDNRVHNNPHAKLESWMLGNKGPSEDWDGDFDFDEPSQGGKHGSSTNEAVPAGLPSGMLVPQTILERQATVHSQFGQVKELTLLVEELKRLQQQASVLDIMTGQSIELWKEAEGIINLATLNDDEEDLFPTRSPRSPGGFDFDVFDEDSPSNRRRRSRRSPPTEDRLSTIDDTSTQASSCPSQELSYSNVHTPPTSRPRKESSAKAKSVLETIHQQRSHHEPALLGDAGMVHKKLPFDTTSLKDLVTRAGVVTRALKEIVRRAEGVLPTSEPQDPLMRRNPPDPPFSQMFQNPPSSPSLSKAPHVAQSPKSLSSKSSKSPKSLKSPKGSPYLGSGSIAGNDNEINGHMKMMTVA